MGLDDTAGNDTGSGTLYASGTGETTTSKLHIQVLGTFEETLIKRRRCGLSVDKSTFDDWDLTDTSLGDLSPSEVCFILRRRSGKTQRQCAAEMGITRYWFGVLEQGKAPCDSLVEFWSKNAG